MMQRLILVYKGCIDHVDKKLIFYGVAKLYYFQCTKKNKKNKKKKKKKQQEKQSNNFKGVLARS